MTAPTRSAAPTERGEGARERREGRALVVALHGASRALKLYPPEHQAVQRALAELTTLAATLGGGDELELRVRGDFLFVNGVRLRLDLANYASLGRLLEVLHAADVGAIVAQANASVTDWLALLRALESPEAHADGVAAIDHALQRASVTAFRVTPGTDDEDSASEAEATKEAARRTYAQSVALTKDVIQSVRMGRAPSSRKIKRAVQMIVDQVLNEETSLIGLTTLRDYDEYTYTHSVNVCIFAIALGRRLGMRKLELYELGLAALLHDIGKSRIPTEVLQKTGALDEIEWRAMTSHPWMGALTLFQLRGQGELPYRAINVAHEHHMKCDLSGYPRPVRPRSLSIASRIVAVADGYDAATTRRSYQTTPYPPSAVLQEMRDNPRRGLDPIVVKAFMALLGVYPPGTVVVLDTYELGVVRAPNPSPELVSRPRVVIVSDERGNLVSPAIEVDLAARGADGQFARTIIKTADPDAYGIRVSDYLV